MYRVALTATGLYIPPYSISNEELVNSFNQYVDEYNKRHTKEIASGSLKALAKSDTAFIEKASGIKSRYVMEREGILNSQIMRPQIPQKADDELSLQAAMGISAAKQALEKAQLQGSDIDMVLLSCAMIERSYPSVAVEIQAALGIQGFALDMSMACSSATFALKVGYDAIATGSVRRVLVISAEICSAHVNFRDRDSHFIFGDAAAAIVLESENLVNESHQGFIIRGTSLHTEFSNHIRNNFGFLNRCDTQQRPENDRLFHQQGRKVFKEVCPAVSAHILAHLDSLSIQPNEVKRFWLHQANRNMNELIARRILGRDATAEEAPIILDQFANTSSVGSVIALHLHQQNLQAKDLGVLSSFGAGYSIGSIVLEKR